MSIVYAKDKRSGITYAYESKSYWDKEKKMPRCKRTLIGRVDPETGEIKPTDGRCRKNSPYHKTKTTPEDLISELRKEAVRLELELKKAKERIAELENRTEER